MTEVNPLDRLNMMVMYQTKGLAHRTPLRLYVLSHMARTDHKLKSSRDIPPDQVIKILDEWHPNWRDPEAIPPEYSSKTLREIAVSLSQQLVAVRGTQAEWNAKLEAEAAQRRAAKLERKAARRKAYKQAKRETAKRGNGQKVVEP